MKQRVVHLDFETRSRIDLKKCGVMKYARDPSTRVLMLAWGETEDNVHLWLPHEGPMPKALKRLLLDPTVKKKAHNAPFERLIFEHVLGIIIPIEEWECSMVRAMMLSLPGKLSELCDVLKLDENHAKDKEGSRLINKFCKPQKITKKCPTGWKDQNTDPEDWDKFCNYCIRDVVAEITVDAKLEKYPTLDVDWRMWHLDQRINDRGMPIDLELAEGAIAISKVITRGYVEKMNHLTGLDNANSTVQLLPWLKQRGYPFENIRKERVALALRDFSGSMTKRCIRILKLRLEAARTSVKKYSALLNRHVDGWVHHVFQFAGAERTNRWGGRGFQPQNLPRSSKVFSRYIDMARKMIRERDVEGLQLMFGDVMSVLAQAIRTVVVAPPKKEICVADLSSIEYLGTGWLAECEKMLDVVRNGRDPYKSFAEAGFGIPYDEVDDDQRQQAKPPVLAAPYGLGPGRELGEYPDVVKTGLWGYAEGMGIAMTQAQSATQHRVYHKAYPEVGWTWNELETAVKTSIRTGRKTKAGPLEFDIMKPFLRMKLPSGRYIYYLRPTIRKVKKVFNGEARLKDQISYEGRDKKRKWRRIETYYGKLFENAVQAWARDVLVVAMLRAEAAGFEIIMHVHDEIVALVKRGMGEVMARRLEKLMAKSIRWLGDIPLGAKGFHADYYQKR